MHLSQRREGAKERAARVLVYSASNHLFQDIVTKESKASQNGLNVFNETKKSLQTKDETAAFEPPLSATLHFPISHLQSFDRLMMVSEVEPFSIPLYAG